MEEIGHEDAPPGRRVLLGGGYRFQTARRHLASYWPTVNQIWVMPDIRPGEEALVRTHEQHHHAMALFQPAQLCPLRAALLGMDASEEAAKFGDIVETLYAVLFPLLVGVPPRPDTFFPSRRQFQLLALRIYHIAQEMAKSAGGAVPQEEAATRAIQAIASLLSYAIPSRPRQGCTILREIEKLAPRPGWTNCMELFHDLYAQAQIRIQGKSPPLSSSAWRWTFTRTCATRFSS